MSRLALPRKLGIARNLRLGALGTARSPAPVLWTPGNLGASLVAWWDANQGVVLSGSNVTSWTDRTGGFVANGGVSPTFSATARNGTPGLTFDGSTQYLTFTPTGFPAGNTARAIAVAGYAASTGGDYAFSYGIENAQNLVAILGSTTTPFPIQGYDGVSNPAASEDWAAIDRFVLFGMDGSSGGTWNIDSNPDEAFSFTTNTILSVGFIGSYIGAGVATFNGVIQQIVVANRALTSSEKAKIAGWESWYDGKAGSSLPIGSPYKSRPPYVSDP
jgi:hypothetical protein